MYLPALRASVVFWLAGLLGACSGNTDQRNSGPSQQSGTGDPVAARTATQTTGSGNAADSGEATELDITLTSNESAVNSGEVATLSWTSQGADTCDASGGWTGSKATSGSEATAPITVSTTYTLTCSGLLGNAVAMIEVAANGVLSISWQPPTENVDGSPLTDLSGYNIYYGMTPGDYSDQVNVGNPSATDFSVTLASGEYYIAMTALDIDGNESALSNEVLKSTL